MCSKSINMSQFRSTSLSQLAEVVKNDNDMWMNSYISQNLAVASHLSPSVIQEALMLQEPMLLPEMRILVIQKGWTCPSINLISHRYESHDLVFMGSNGLFQLESMSADIQGFAFSVSDELFSLALGNLIPKAFDGHLRSFHLPSIRRTGVSGTNPSFAVCQREVGDSECSGEFKPHQCFSVVYRQNPWRAFQ